MAGLGMKGHHGLTPLLVSKQQALHGFCSSSRCSFHVISAKTSPKVETKKDQQTPKPFVFSVNGKNIEMCMPPQMTEKQVPASAQQNKRKKGNAEKQEDVATAQSELDQQLRDVPLVRGRASKEENVEEYLSAHDDKDLAEEDADDSEDLDEEEDTKSDLGVSELDDVIEMFVPPGAVFSQEKPLAKLPGSNIYIGPYARGGKIKEAAFVKSSKSVLECPPLKLPEFAMVGRSNVGKSSLINALVQRKDLASTSKKPGKTQLINHFIINKSWYLVDLPGYGYAKVPASLRGTWDSFTKEFFLQSKNLVCVMLLVDASIPPQQNDLEYADWLHTNKVPMTIVFTKCDRKKKKKNGGRKPVENIKDFLIQLKGKFDKSPPWIMTSCVTNQGKDGLFLHMSQLRNYWSA